MSEAVHPGFMVFGEGLGFPTVLHRSFEKAVGEARRLATQNRGTRYWVYGPDGHAFLARPEAEYVPLPAADEQEARGPQRMRRDGFDDDDMPF